MLAYHVRANAALTFPSAMLWSGMIFAVAVTVDFVQTLLSLKHNDGTAAEELMMRSCELLRPPYRSFFIVPICTARRDGLIPLGYLSIDSTRPYEFYGNRANVLAVECESIIARLKKLMQEAHP